MLILISRSLRNFVAIFSNNFLLTNGNRGANICSKKYELEYMSKEPALDLVVDSLIINLGEDGDSEGKWESENSDSGNNLSGIEYLDQL